MIQASTDAKPSKIREAYGAKAEHIDLNIWLVDFGSDETDIMDRLDEYGLIWHTDAHGITWEIETL